MYIALFTKRKDCNLDPKAICTLSMSIDIGLSKSYRMHVVLLKLDNLNTPAHKGSNQKGLLTVRMLIS